MDKIPLLDDKCVGALVSAAVGDALGWPNEGRARNKQKGKQALNTFQAWQRTAGGRYWRHTERILAGEYSDDTQMLLAVSRSLLSGRSWRGHFTTRELPFWLEYQRGGGGAMLRAAKAWESKTEPWRGKEAKKYYDAGGNGAAMRILPHVIVHADIADFHAVAEAVAEDAMLTHGHPRAILGALCYAYALYYLLQKQDTLEFGELLESVCEAEPEWGKFSPALSEDWLLAAGQHLGADYKALWSDTVDLMMKELKIASSALKNGILDMETKTLEALGCFDKKINGAGDVTAVAAIYLASKYANNPTLGVKSAANAFGSDTDTLASMTGGLLGMLCGSTWLPAEWKFVQDYDCLVRIAGFLLSKDGVQEVKDHTAKRQGERTDWEKSPIGGYRKLGTHRDVAGKTGTVTIETYMTALGQTLYISRYSREQEAVPVVEPPQERARQFYALRIDPPKAVSMLCDEDLRMISFGAVLRVLELYNQSITEINAIAESVGLSPRVVQKILSLVIPHNDPSQL